MNYQNSCLNSQRHFGYEIPSLTPFAPLPCLLILPHPIPTAMTCGLPAPPKNTSKISPVPATSHSIPCPSPTCLKNLSSLRRVGSRGRVQGVWKECARFRSNSDVLYSVSSEGKLTTRSCIATSTGTKPWRAPAYFPWPRHKPLTSFQAFAIHPLLFGACGCMRLCSRVWGRSDCKLGGGGDGGGPNAFVKTNRNALNLAFPPLER